jgi:hypothetical protein
MGNKPAVRQLDLPIRVADNSFFILFGGAIRQGLVRDIGPTSFTVLVVLKANARPTDGRVYLSVGDISKVTGMAANTVRKALKTLEDQQLIQVVQTGETARRRYFIVDYFRWKKLGDGSVTDALEALEAGHQDGVSSVVYVPRSSAIDQQQLQAWMTANAVPLSPNVQVVAQKVERQVVVNQQVHNQQVHNQQVHNHFHGLTAETVDAMADAVVAKATVKLEAPFLQNSRLLASKLTQTVTELRSDPEVASVKK